MRNVPRGSPPQSPELHLSAQDSSADATGTTRHFGSRLRQKDAIIYVVDRDNMGKFNANQNNLYELISGTTRRWPLSGHRIRRLCGGLLAAGGEAYNAVTIWKHAANRP